MKQRRGDRGESNNGGGGSRNRISCGARMSVAEVASRTGGGFRRKYPSNLESGRRKVSTHAALAILPSTTFRHSERVHATVRTLSPAATLRIQHGNDIFGFTYMSVDIRSAAGKPRTAYKCIAMSIDRALAGPPEAGTPAWTEACTAAVRSHMIDSADLPLMWQPAVHAASRPLPILYR